jgi:hypothetical protein
MPNQYESYGTALGHLNKWSDEDVWDMIVKNERREANPSDETRNLYPKNQIAGDNPTLNRLSDNSI